MRKILLTSLFLAMAFSAFAGSYDLVLQWDENKEPDLATGEKARYKIYMRDGESLAGLKANATEPVINVRVADDENHEAGLVQKTVTSLDDQRVYFIAVTALDESGNESDLSNEVSSSGIDVTPPDAPIGMKILRWIKQMISKLFGGLRIV